jgi:hypothetical protein
MINGCDQITKHSSSSDDSYTLMSPSAYSMFSMQIAPEPLRSWIASGILLVDETTSLGVQGPAAFRCLMVADHWGTCGHRDANSLLDFSIIKDIGVLNKPTYTCHEASKRDKLPWCDVLSLRGSP